MWQLAAESLSGFSEVIVTAMSHQGYPVSVRQPLGRYDANTGKLPVLIPASLEVVPGPANVLAHYHDENLSNLQMMQIKGHLESRDDTWIFITTAFKPPPRGKLKSRWQMAMAMRRASRRYLAARSVRRPRVNWAAIKTLQQQAQRGRSHAS